MLRASFFNLVLVASSTLTPIANSPLTPMM